MLSVTSKRYPFKCNSAMVDNIQLNQITGVLPTALQETQISSQHTEGCKGTFKHSQVSKSIVQKQSCQSTLTTPDQKRRRRKPNGLSVTFRTMNKINRNSNKPYVNYKGLTVTSREFIDYDCKCNKNCHKRLCVSERLDEFNKFWALSSYDAQTAFIASKVCEQPVKKRYGKKECIKKYFSRIYSLCSGAICRDMFCRTLQISSSRINTALKKNRTQTKIQDQRGMNKISPDNVERMEYELEIRDTYFEEQKNKIKQEPIEVTDEAIVGQKRRLSSPTPPTVPPAFIPDAAPPTVRIKEEDLKLEVVETPLTRPFGDDAKSDYMSENAVSLPGLKGTPGPVGFEPGMFGAKDDLGPKPKKKKKEKKKHKHKHKHKHSSKDKPRDLHKHRDDKHRPPAVPIPPTFAPAAVTSEMLRIKDDTRETFSSFSSSQSPSSPSHFTGTSGMSF